MTSTDVVILDVRIPENEALLFYISRVLKQRLKHVEQCDTPDLRELRHCIPLLIRARQIGCFRHLFDGRQIKRCPHWGGLVRSQRWNDLKEYLSGIQGVSQHFKIKGKKVVLLGPNEHLGRRYVDILTNMGATTVVCVEGKGKTKKVKGLGNPDLVIVLIKMCKHTNFGTLKHNNPKCLFLICTNGNPRLFITKITELLDAYKG